MTDNSFGQMVADHRKRQGWSQEKLAEESGLTTRAISAIEQGQVRDPRISTIRALGRVLGDSFFTAAYRYNDSSSSLEVQSA
ncbi:helix-turn-helix domain-containing protein [Deinococcus yunweiensis]|uniref:helix-turn-helix domain-containing protein n=1 Tax=Deinococcus yunweiensis TaxID=367282 RepID=UPI00398F74B2